MRLQSGGENLMEGVGAAGGGVLLGALGVAEVGDGVVGADEVDFGGGLDGVGVGVGAAEGVGGPFLFEAEGAAAEAVGTEF